MSDFRRTAVGCILLLVGLLLCVLPDLFLESRNSTYFRASVDSWRLTGPVETWQAGPIRINAADTDELLNIPGVGETFASLIVSEREQNGAFHYPEDLISVRGIGPKSVDKMRNMIDLTMDESRK